MQADDQQIDKILNKIEEKNSLECISQAFEILSKLILNIVNDPYNNKFRTVKTTNNTIKTKVMNLLGIDSLLLTLGYELQNEEIYLLKDNKLADLLQGASAIDCRRRLIAARLTSNAAYKKELEVVKEQKLQQMIKKKRQSQSKRLKQQCQADKKQRKYMKIDESKSNQLRFGANSSTLKDIGVDLCNTKKGG